MQGAGCRMLTLLALASIAIAFALPPPVGIWNQIHHDPRNSGRATWTTQLQDGKCDIWAAYANNTFGQEVIQANGVMSLDGNMVYYVGKAPTYHVVHQLDTVTGVQLNVWTNYLIQLNDDAVGSIVVGPNLLVNDADGVFYSMGEYVYSLTPQWGLGFQHPIYAPLRLGPQGGMLLVSTSNATHDSNGVLHAIDTMTGKEVWNFTAIENGKTWGMRITPAVTEQGIVFACYGQTLVALDATNGGKEVARISTLPLLAVFGSSPTITADGLSLYIQSKSDDLWRYNLNSTTPPMKFEADWVCRYTTLVPDCVNLQNIAEVMEHPEELSLHFRHQLFGEKPVPEMSYEESDARRLADAEKWGTDPPFLNLGDDNRATPALGVNDATIVFPLYTSMPGQGGVHSALPTGDRNWRYLSAQDNAQLGDMMSRSSAALDAEGNVFIGMDQVDPGESNVPPVLLALDFNGNRLWVDGGTNPGPYWNPIGLRSPMLGFAATETAAQGKVFFPRDDVLEAFAPGTGCPSATPLHECSGHGTCNCNTGVCACELLTCFYGDDCGTEETCNDEGECIEGVCTCTNQCYTGPQCQFPNACSNRGTCGLGGCQCNSPCYFGPDCEDVKDCSGQGNCDMGTGVCVCNPGATGPNCSEQMSPPSGGMGAGWVFIIVMLCVGFSSTLLYAVYMKRRTGEWYIWKWRADRFMPKSSANLGERQPLAAGPKPVMHSGDL